MGTGPSSHSSSVERVCFVRCMKFKGNFMMAFCSFGGVSDQCGATSWAAHETGMIPLLSCEIDMTEWLKEKYKGSGASGARGRPGLTKATGESNYQLGIYPRTNGFKLFVCDELSRGNLLGSCEEKLTFNKIIVHRKGKSID